MTGMAPVSIRRGSWEPATPAEVAEIFGSCQARAIGPGKSDHAGSARWLSRQILLPRGRCLTLGSVQKFAALAAGLATGAGARIRAGAGKPSEA